MSCALVMQVKSYCNDDNINIEQFILLFLLLFLTPGIMDITFFGEGWLGELQLNVAAVIKSVVQCVVMSTI